MQELAEKPPPHTMLRNTIQPYITDSHCGCSNFTLCYAANLKVDLILQGRYGMLYILTAQICWCACLSICCKCAHVQCYRDIVVPLAKVGRLWLTIVCLAQHKSVWELKCLQGEEVAYRMGEGCKCRAVHSKQEGTKLSTDHDCPQKQRMAKDKELATICNHKHKVKGAKDKEERERG